MRIKSTHPLCYQKHEQGKPFSDLHDKQKMYIWSIKWKVEFINNSTLAWMLSKNDPFLRLFFVLYVCSQSFAFILISTTAILKSFAYTALDSRTTLLFEDHTSFPDYK